LARHATAIDLPARLDRLSEAIETGGLEVHLRPDDMDALLAGAGRFANRVAASVLAAAVIDGVVRLVPGGGTGVVSVASPISAREIGCGGPRYFPGDEDQR
jgi:hypothetical protein